MPAHHEEKMGITGKFVCMYVYTQLTCSVITEKQKGIGALGTGVTDGCGYLNGAGDHTLVLCKSSPCY
ncbi:hypothetical protein STEG23_025911 [Scotinomys teguina]